MAKWEIKKRFGISEALWWRFAAGPEISVRWPSGWVVLDEMPDGSTTSTQSADPNDHFRPWLEKNVGRQGWDWNWRHHIVATDNEIIDDQVIIKFRKKHQDAALIAKMRWM